MDLSCCFESDYVLKPRDCFVTIKEQNIRMKKTLSLFTTLGVSIATLHAQEQIQTDSVQAQRSSLLLKEPARAKSFQLDVLLRAGLQTDNGEGESQAKANLDDARILMSGEYNDRLSYKVRFRLNRSFAPTSQDNGSRALDMALIKYKFGKDLKWSVTAGKQSAMVGSYEFENNPIYEYKFTDYVDRILNLFVVGGMLSYEVNPNHSLHAQVYNTTNDSFMELHAKNGFAVGDLERSSVPMGAYFTWVGAFMDKRFNTKWSYNISQFAKGHTNHAVSLANKFKTAKQMLYLDLQYSYLAVDHAMIASSAINEFYGRTGEKRVLAKDVNYSSAILRYDQFLSKKWEVALKGGYEVAGSRDDNQLGKNFRQNWTYFAALQHKPFHNQDLRFYLGYVGNTVNYKGYMDIAKSQYNRLAFGAYFTIPVL